MTVNVETTPRRRPGRRGATTGHDAPLLDPGSVYKPGSMVEPIVGLFRVGNRRLIISDRQPPPPLEATDVAAQAMEASWHPPATPPAATQRSVQL